MTGANPGKRYNLNPPSPSSSSSPPPSHSTNPTNYQLLPMAYSPLTILDAQAQIDNDRARELKAAAQKASSRKALLSQAPAAAAASSTSSSSSQGQGLKKPLPTPSSAGSPSSSHTSHRASHFHPSSSSSMSQHFARQYASVDDEFDEDWSYDLALLSDDEDDDDDSASETEHDAAPVNSSMPTGLYDNLSAWPLLSRGKSIILTDDPLSPSSLVITDADPMFIFSFLLSDIVALTERHARASPSPPPKRDSPLLTQSPETIEGTLPLCAERAFDGPGLGLNDNRHWLEAEEEDGFACWTAYANDDQSTSSVIVVRECRW